MRTVRIVQLRVIGEASHHSPALHTSHGGGLRHADPVVTRCAALGPGHTESLIAVLP